MFASYQKPQDGVKPQSTMTVDVLVTGAQGCISVQRSIANKKFSELFLYSEGFYNQEYVGEVSESLF